MKLSKILAVLAVGAIAPAAHAQTISTYYSDAEIAEKSHPIERTYSPWVDRNFPQRR